MSYCLSANCRKREEPLPSLVEVAKKLLSIVYRKALEKSDWDLVKLADKVIAKEKEI